MDDESTITPTETLPAYSAAPARKARPGGVIAIAIGVVAAMLATLFAVVSLSSGGGSASPEEAVERLLGAAADEDLIGVLESLDPGERSAVLPGIEGIATELKRIGVLADDLDLGAVGGLDIEIEGLALESEELGTGVSAVRITGGTITASTDPAGLPLSDKLRELVEEEEDADLEPTTSTEDMASEDLAIVALDRGDGWHVSLFYSVAEAIRAETDQPVPDFDDGVDAEGASSPEDAVRAMVEAGVDLDLRRVISLLPPDEMRVLHDYAPLFLDEVEDDIAEARETTDINLDRLDLESEVDGDTASVTVGGFVASGTVDDEDFEVDFDGDCIATVFDGDDEEQCLSELTEEMGGRASMLPTEMTVTTVERDGEWFVSPVRSSFDAVLTMLASIDDDILDDVESFEDLMWSFLSGGSGMNPLMLGSSGEFDLDGREYAEDVGPDGTWSEGDDEAYLDEESYLDEEAESGFGDADEPSFEEGGESSFDDESFFDDESSFDDGSSSFDDDMGGSFDGQTGTEPKTGAVEPGVSPELEMSPVDICWAPVDELPSGATADEWEAAEVLVDECLAEIDG